MLAQCCHLVLFHPKIEEKKTHLFYSDSSAQDITGFLFFALLLPNKVSFGDKKEHELIYGLINALLINIITCTTTTLIIIIMVIIAFEVRRMQPKLNMRSLGTRI